MANIKINDLNTAGSDLFNDSESYLNELTEDELNLTKGGSSPLCVAVIISVSVVSVGVYRHGRDRGWWK